MKEALRFSTQNYLGMSEFPSRINSISVYGAGFSGLCLGTFLKSKGVGSLQIVENGSLGGLIQTEQTPLGIIEWAANGYMSGSPGIEKLEEILHLSSIGCRRESRKKFVIRGGVLKGLFACLPLATQLVLPFRLAAFLAGAKVNPTMSVFDFFKQVGGVRFAEILGSAFVTGIYGGNPRELCFATSFSKMFEKFSGDIDKTKKASRPKLRSYAGGMGILTDAMAGYLKEEINGPSQRGHYHLVTVPAYRAANLLPQSLSETVALLLSQIQYVSIVNVHVFVKKSKLQKLPMGFGALVPENQDSDVLGVLFAHSIFSHRVSDPDVASLTFLLGGTRSPLVCEKSDDEIEAIILNRLKHWLGLSGSIESIQIRRIPSAIPQYSQLHAQLLVEIDQKLRQFNEGSDEKWILFGNYTGQVALRGIADGALKLSSAIAEHCQVQKPELGLGHAKNQAIDFSGSLR